MRAITGTLCAECPSMKICNSVYCENLIRPKLQFLKEELWCVALSEDFELISFQRLAFGGQDEVLIPTGELIQFVHNTQAKNLVLVHSHCGSCSLPSSHDLFWTERLKSLFDLLEVQLCDHIIISKKNATSLLEWDPLIFE